MGFPKSEKSAVLCLCVCVFHVWISLSLSYLHRRQFRAVLRQANNKRLAKKEKWMDRISSKRSQNFDTYRSQLSQFYIHNRYYSEKANKQQHQQRRQRTKWIL